MTHTIDKGLRAILDAARAAHPNNEEEVRDAYIVAAHEFLKEWPREHRIMVLDGFWNEAKW